MSWLIVNHPFLNLSLFQVFCCRYNPAVVKSRPCSDDSHKGWIQDWDIMHQTWEHKGFGALFTCLELVLVDFL